MDKSKYDIHSPNGELAGRINARLIESKRIGDYTLKEIISIHEHKLIIHEDIEKETDLTMLPHYAKMLTHYERKLQVLWGFPVDEKFHRFWNTPRCTCPKLDNEDRYPHRYYIRNLECPLHKNE